MKKKHIWFMYFISIFIYAMATYSTIESFSDIHSFFTKLQFYQKMNMGYPIQYIHIYLTVFFIIFITIPLIHKFFNFSNKYIRILFSIFGAIMLGYSVFKYYQFGAFQTLLTITFVILIIFQYMLHQYSKK